MKCVTNSVSRSEALARLQAFLPRASTHYGSFRNYDEGTLGRSNVSELSPFISRRLISEGEIIKHVFDYYGDAHKSCERFFQELLWRAYWRSYLELRPSIWTFYCKHLDCTVSENFSHPFYDKAISGTTEIAAFNHWVHELQETGYLHNHARLWFASIWIHTFQLPWEWGAAFFLSHLFDGDAASNTLSWRWVAGLHTRGKYYLTSSENIEKFTYGKCGAKGLASTPFLQSEDRVHPLVEPKSYSTLQEMTETSVPKTDLLILCGDDLSIETLTECGTYQPAHVVILNPMTVQKAFKWSERVRLYHGAAIDDAESRIEGLWRTPIDLISQEEVTGKIPEWLKAGIQRVVVIMPHVGPYQDALGNILDLLSPCFPIVCVRRLYDCKLDALGKRGFFDFWKNLPDLRSLINT